MEEKHFAEHIDEHVEFLPVEWRSKLSLDGGGWGFFFFKGYLFYFCFYLCIYLFIYYDSNSNQTVPTSCGNVSRDPDKCLDMHEGLSHRWM